MNKSGTGIDVLTSAKQRISKAFDESERVYVAFSGGKDSTVMTHLVAEEAEKRGRRFGLMFIDLEAQYEITINHVSKVFEAYKHLIEPLWFCYPLTLRNSVSVYEPEWICWDTQKQNLWVRQPPATKCLEHWTLPFFRKGMEFEEFIVEFGEYYSEEVPTACFVGIRSDESLNRFLAVANSPQTKTSFNVTSYYPIYDWKVEDIWTYHAKYSEKFYNILYDRMYQAGVPLNSQRICQPYGDEQKRGLWLYQIIEPQTWVKVVARVSGANYGAVYSNSKSNMSGLKLSLPKGHTWKSFGRLLVDSMPRVSRNHYQRMVSHFEEKWIDRCYIEGIPDHAPKALESNCDVPSWRKVCKTILKNDFWGRSLGYMKSSWKKTTKKAT